MPEKYFFHNPLRNVSFNPFIKVFIISDMFFWGIWSTILPLLSVLVINEIPGTTIQTVTFGYSLYLLGRISGGILSGFRVANASENKKLQAVIFGILIVSLGYLGFAITRNLLMFLLFYTLTGLGIGIASPIRAALFTQHIQKHQETIDWAVLDSLVLSSVAATALVGGFIIQHFGFNALFVIGMCINTFTALPYIFYMKRKKVQ